jgi:hypothetical protein
VLPSSSVEQDDVAIGGLARELVSARSRPGRKDEFPGAAASVREGLDETLTVLRLPLSDRLRCSLATTNRFESLTSRRPPANFNIKRGIPEDSAGRTTDLA